MISSLEKLFCSGRNIFSNVKKLTGAPDGGAVDCRRNKGFTLWRDLMKCVGELSGDIFFMFKPVDTPHSTLDKMVKLRLL